MTLMFAGVTGALEAESAWVAGADVVDVIRDAGVAAAGEGTGGAVKEIVASLRGRCPISAATGIELDDPGRLGGVMGALVDAGAAYIRQDIGPADDLAQALGVMTPFAGRAALVAVLAATGAADFRALPAIAAAGFTGAMLDSEAGGRRLMDLVDITVLRRFVENCHACGLVSGFAGRLEAPDVPRLMQLQPDLLGFRDALHRRGAHPGAFDRHAAAKIRALIPRSEPQAGLEAGAPAEISRPVETGAAPTDRVFLRDLILPIYIGAYGHEKQAPQRVRFSVDVRVSRLGRPSHEMRDVFSYDVILDAIRLLVDAGHFMFIETLAERIAARLLAEPRARTVTVKLEKLDLGPYRVGVTIERDRTGAQPVPRARLVPDTSSW